MTNFPFHPTLTLGVSLDHTPKPSKITLNLLLAVQKVLFMCILYQASSLLALNLTSLPAVNSNPALFPAMNLTSLPAVNSNLTLFPAVNLTSLPAVNLTSLPAVNSNLTLFPAVNLTSLPAVNSNLTSFPVVNLAGVIGHSCMTASWLGCFNTGCLTVRIRNGGLFNGMPTVPTHPALMSF